MSTTEKKHICKICGKEFKSGGALGGHMAMAHGEANKKKEYKCPICGKVLFTNKGAFKNHLKNHDEEFKKNKGEKISKAKIEFYADEEKSEFARKLMSEKMKKDNPMYNQETIDKMTKSRKEYINNLSDEEYSKMVINFINAPKKGNAVNHSGKYTPTKIEQMIIDLSIPKLKYNGNCKDSITIRFKHKNFKHSLTPDFIYENTNKLIETFGVYWHKKEDEEIYINACKENGYEVLILWEDDLYNNFKDCKNKILKFLKGE